MFTGGQWRALESNARWAGSSQPKSDALRSHRSDNLPSPLALPTPSQLDFSASLTAAPGSFVCLSHHSTKLRWLVVVLFAWTQAAFGIEPALPRSK